MEEKRTRERELVRAYRAAKRKLVLPWKLLCIFLAAATALTLPLSILANASGGAAAAAYLDVPGWELENPDPGAQYFSVPSQEEAEECALELCRRAAADGSVLLMNENAALPLAAGGRISLFSAGLAGGDSLNAALELAGFSVNPTLRDFCLSGQDGEQPDGGSAPGEAAWSACPDEVKRSAADYGDAAVVLLSRAPDADGEASSPEAGLSALSQNERDMLSAAASLRSAGTVKKLILLLDVPGPFQLDFLKENEYAVDACLWTGAAGSAGAEAVADILSGSINPSGRLADTLCYNILSAPAAVNSLPSLYEAGGKNRLPDNAGTYTVRQEGIYVGYRYYETRYEDAVMGTGNAGDYVYADDVAFPFGHGLSYTDFTLRHLKVRYNSSALTYTVSVTVTNDGARPGRETVQIYAQSPYTAYDREHGVEKASVRLVGFGKTAELSPGQAETLEITVNRRDLASYDAHGAGTYILDAGTWYFTAAADAHSAVNNILSAKGYTRFHGMDADGDPALVWSWTERVFDAVSCSFSSGGAPVANRLSQSDPNLCGALDEPVVWLSRSDWMGTLPTRSVKLALTDRLRRELRDVRYDPGDYPAVDMPAMGAENGMKLYDMIGLDYDDPAWETLLDQLTFDEMAALVGGASRYTAAAKSAAAPGALLGDLSRDLSGLPSGSVLASAFDMELAAQAGRAAAGLCLDAGIACLRIPGGASLSEDPLLSASVSSAGAAALQTGGVRAVMGDPAPSGSEEGSDGGGVWLSEQAAREIYLKALQTPVETGSAGGVLLGSERWGAHRSGTDRGLGHILREEWGCRGIILAPDSGPAGVLAGVSVFRDAGGSAARTLARYRNDPVIVAAMRSSCHSTLYAVANSCAMNGVGPDTDIRIVRPAAVTAVTAAAWFSLLGFLLSAAVWAIQARRLRAAPQYAAYLSRKQEEDPDRPRRGGEA